MVSIIVSLNNSLEWSIFDKYILGSGTNVFEMTMAEEDREDQKRRHRLSREKFENLF